MADSYLSKTPNASNRKTLTISVWIKRNALGSSPIFTANTDISSDASGHFSFDGDNTLHYRSWTGSAYAFLIMSARKFTDTTSWTHIVIAQDTTQSTDTNRIKMYINGEQVTKFKSGTAYPSQNYDGFFNSNILHNVGRGNDGGIKFFDGHFAHFHFVDGSALAPTVFGETDSTTGEWKPILSPSVTYGTNGFFLKFENSSALGTDSSGNTNTYTVNGSLKQSVSTPNNLFCTLDSNQTNTATDVQHAGTSLFGRTTTAFGANGTLCMKKGKWYWEVKVATDRTTADGATIGVYKANSAASIRWKNTGASAIVGKETGAYLGNQGMTYQPMTSTPNIISDGDSGTVNYGSQASENDIIMVALDLDNGKWWLGKNGTWFNAPGTSNAGVPNTGANAGISFTVDGDYWGCNITTVNNNADNANKYMYVNFGEGRFGTTAVASGNADDAGQGTFEYDVPAGFYAICTRNIKDYG